MTLRRPVIPRSKLERDWQLHRVSGPPRLRDGHMSPVTGARRNFLNNPRPDEYDATGDLWLNGP